MAKDRTAFPSLPSLLRANPRRDTAVHWFGNAAKRYGNASWLQVSNGMLLGWVQTSAAAHIEQVGGHAGREEFPVDKGRHRPLRPAVSRSTMEALRQTIALGAERRPADDLRPTGDRQ